MQKNEWDKIVLQYEHTYLNSKYADHARAMLDLIPQIIENATFADVVPSVTHATLVLGLAGKESSIYIWYEGSDLYSVYIYHHNLGKSRENTARSENLMATLGGHLEVLRQVSV